MASLPSLVKNFSTFLQNNQVSFTNGLLILFTLGGEQIFRFTAFQCPCSQPQALTYACSFVAGPAIVLSILGVVINNLTWRLCHGCRYRSLEYKHSSKETCEHCIAVLARALIVPSAWIFITFLDGNYYVCMVSSSPCASGSDENKNLLATSQIISWAFLVCVVAAASLVIFVCRCIDTVTYMQNRYVIIYRDIEGALLESNMQEVAKKKAEASVKAFMANPEIKKEDWDSISKAPDHRIKLEQEQPSSLTPLQKWYRDQINVTTEQNHNQATDNIVTVSAMKTEQGHEQRRVNKAAIENDDNEITQSALDIKGRTLLVNCVTGDENRGHGLAAEMQMLEKTSTMQTDCV